MLNSESLAGALSDPFAYRVHIVEASGEGSRLHEAKQRPKTPAPAFSTGV